MRLCDSAVPQVIEEASIPMFTAILKGILVLFILIGIPFALYGAWEIWGTMNMRNIPSTRVKATFTGYHREVHESSTIQSSPHMSSQGIETSESVALYPEFTYRTEDGTVRRVRDSKVHVIERYKPGDEVEILVTPQGIARLADFFSLYSRDLLILAIGLGFILIPLVIWKGLIPVMETTSAGAEFAAFWDSVFGDVAKIIKEFKVGPLPFRYILFGMGGLFGLVLIVSVISGLAPFVAQMHFGAGGRLIQALEQKRFDDARVMIVKGKGIRARNEYNQNALLLALEAGQTELARLLIEAGAEVNISSKMDKNPLQIATRSGDLEMVKLLLAHGASPDSLEQGFPAFLMAVAKGHDEIARLLIDAGTDLHRRYQIKDLTVTVGDYAVLAKKPELAELIRQRGGSFSKIAEKLQEAHLGQEVDRDGRFVAYSNGVVIDTETDLMWAAGDNGANIDWNRAKLYCQTYKGAGYTDWRMPTPKELAGLYGTGEESPQECKPSSSVKITKLIRLTCCCPWSSEEDGSSAVYVYFKDGKGYRTDKAMSRYQRILPVRSNR